MKRGVSAKTADPASGKFPLAVAGTWASIELARLLLAYGADPNQQDFYGRTAIMYAAPTQPESLSIEFLDFMVAAGDDPSLADYRGETAETIARRFGNENIARRIRELQSQR